MNGRLYDPHIARMMQADPIIAGLVDAQYFNRYSYVFNRPTSLTDATGECPVCFWVIGAALFARAVGIIDTKTLRAIVGIAVVPLLGPQGVWAVFGQGYALANVAIAGFVSGAISSGSLKGGFQGAFSAMLTYGVGSLGEGLGAAQGAGGTGIWGDGGIGHVMLHAGAGCINATLTGGNCGRGAATAGISAFLSGNLPGAGKGNIGWGTLRAAIIGGTVSVIGGGKFANGARTAAFQYIFNCEAHKCSSTDYDPNDPRTHVSRITQSPELCNTSSESCLSFARQELGCNSAPGQSGCTAVGEQKSYRLTGDNWITQYRPNDDLIINGTTAGAHFLDDGYVVRWIGVSPSGSVSIYSAGYGTNLNRFRTFINGWLGPNLFITIGQNNADRVRHCVKLNLKSC